jgi:hypothetical protein
MQRGVLIAWGWLVKATSRPLYPRGSNSVYPLCRRLGLPWGLVLTGAKISPPSPLGFKPPNRPARCYADYAIPTARVYVNIPYYIGRSFHSGNFRRGADDIFPFATDGTARPVAVSPLLSRVKKKN